MEFYGHPVTSFQRKPWSEAHAVFRVVLISPVWKEIKGGRLPAARFSLASVLWTVQGIRCWPAVKVKMTGRPPEGGRVSSGSLQAVMEDRRGFLSTEGGDCGISYLSVDCVFPFLK